MDSALTSVFLPAALAVIMFGLGLGLTVADFRRVVVYPKAAFVALLCQIVVLPLICFGLVLAFGLAPGLAVGMMLLAASPGGTSANLYSHLFGGDVALNVTLTAINSVLAVFTLPLVTNLAISHFAAGNGQVGLQFDKTAQVFLIVLIPVAIGMAVRARFAAFARWAEKPVKILSALILLAVIVGAIVKEAANLGGYIASVGLITLAFSVLSLTIGYWAPRLSGVEPRQAIASCMEIGIHNSTLAITVAVSLLGSTEIAIPAAVYGVLMFFTAAAAGVLLRRSAARSTTVPA
ncbi:bile acid:sodium symporter family protein [Planobispora longispora]|uniref:Transporter n=1 Tax=Planobispora longispora TaxID=28887 RepID=A0A8J3RMB5_9ACTN|nr:bile acid:sodium symporter family protein [Planobispora longispora]BFE80558.1 bile acid:sodium symporter family protein [Planobispora longispora]GIH79226.1 transporter [Planobispora longispora]